MNTNLNAYERTDHMLAHLCVAVDDAIQNGKPLPDIVDVEQAPAATSFLHGIKQLLLDMQGQLDADWQSFSQLVSNLFDVSGNEENIGNVDPIWFSHGLAWAQGYLVGRLSGVPWNAEEQGFSEDLDSQIDSWESDLQIALSWVEKSAELQKHQIAKLSFSGAVVG